MSTQISNTCSQQPCETKATTNHTYRTPIYDIREEQELFKVTVEVPGVTQQNVSVSLDSKELRIDAVRDIKTPENWKQLSRGIPTADYRLSLNVEADIDSDNITAQLNNGVLTVSLPKAEQLKPRKIEVK